MKIFVQKLSGGASIHCFALISRKNKIIYRTTEQNIRARFVITPLADVTERPVPRRADYQAQKEEYSGKKKQHTIKNFALTAPE